MSIKTALLDIVARRYLLEDDVIFVHVFKLLQCLVISQLYYNRLQELQLSIDILLEEFTKVRLKVPCVS